MLHVNSVSFSANNSESKKNKLRTAVDVVGVGALTAATAYAVKKAKTEETSLNKLVTNIAAKKSTVVAWIKEKSAPALAKIAENTAGIREKLNGFKTIQTVKEKTPELYTKAKEGIKNLPTSAKVVAGVGLALAAAGYVYRKGQAKGEEKASDAIDAKLASKLMSFIEKANNA